MNPKNNTNFNTSLETDTERLVQRILRFIHVKALFVIFILFYISVIFHSFHPIALTWEENKRLIAYNNEVLIYEGMHQSNDPIASYNTRYAYDFRDSTANMVTTETLNTERMRDLEILKSALRLNSYKHAVTLPIARTPLAISRGTEFFDGLEKILYHIPEEPAQFPYDHPRYTYQSNDGIAWTITVYLDEPTTNGALVLKPLSYSYPELQ